MPFGLPIAQACAQQWPGQDDAPLAVLAADADVDELRVEHDLAKTFLDRFHGRGRISRPVQADRLHVLHRITGAGHGLLQIADAVGVQRQPRVAGQRWQFLRYLTRAALHLAAVEVDRINQLFLVGRQRIHGEQHPQ
ncbi:hypothetical protein D3C84_1020030 [compost metagenome]